MSFKEILVPVDFSETSLHAIRQAVRVARESNGRLTLVHIGVVPYVDAGPFGASIPAALIAAHDQMAAERMHALQRVAKEEIPDGMPVRFKVREGFPPEEILAEAEEGKQDLICIGTHGRTGVERVILGSVAERVIRGAKVPVLVTR